MEKLKALEDARSWNKVPLVYFPNISLSFKSFSQFLSFRTLIIWISLRGTSPTWWKLGWNFVRFKRMIYCKKKRIKIRISWNSYSLPLDGKAVVFGKLTLNKANWSLKSILLALQGSQWASIERQLDKIQFVWNYFL